MKIKNQSILIGVVFVFILCIALYSSGSWIHMMQTTYNNTSLIETDKHQLVENIKLVNQLKPENLQFWTNDSICHKTRLEKDGHMTSEIMSYFNLVSCDKNNSTCEVKIVAVSGLKAKKKIGGDLFLMWAEQIQGDGRSVGHVTDNSDGTYTGIIKFYWAGKTVIKVKLGCTLENFCRRRHAMIKYGNSVFAINRPWGILATFQTNFTKEETRCGIYNKIQGYTLMCNLTAINDGSPWFCGKPNSPNLTCLNVYEYNGGYFKRMTGDPYPNSPEVISKYGHGQLKPTLTLNSVSSVKYKDHNGTCRTSSRRDSWFSDSGVYIMGKWIIPYCKCKTAFSIENYNTCLKNKTIVVLGDSTVRDYASFLLRNTVSMPLIDLKHRKGNNRTYHPTSDFKQNGIRIIYKKHELPFHHPHVPINGVTSLVAELQGLAYNEIHGEDLIVLINYNSHLHAYPPDKIRVRLKNIAAALEVLLKEKPAARIFIKGPHVHFDDTRYFDLRVSLIEKDLIFQEFYHLYDKIIYLDTWSITTAFDNQDLHPKGYALRSQLQQFISYICRD